MREGASQGPVEVSQTLPPDVMAGAEEMQHVGRLEEDSDSSLRAQRCRLPKMRSLGSTDGKIP